jgi:hypothetical protein
MNRKKRLLVRLAVLAAFVVGCALYSRVYGAKPLLERSRRFVTINDIDINHPYALQLYGFFQGGFKHAWVAGNRAIYLDSDAKHDLYLYSKNLEGGNVSILKGLSARVKQPMTGGLSFWDVTPDGTRFVWEKGAGLRGTVYECDLYGKDFTQTNGFGCIPFWMPDGKQWIEGGYSIRIHGIAGTDEKGPPERELPLDEQSPLRQHYGLEAGLIRSDYHIWLPGFSNDDDAHVNWNQSKLSIMDIDLRNRGKTSCSWDISLPFPAAVREARISLDGKQIAMTLTNRQTSLFGRLMKKVFRSYPDNVTTAGLWVANINGTNMHCLGTVIPPANRDSLAYPRDLRWLPDSKRISYLYGNGIYIIPAN